jgi:oxaloacetate decarboxylase alpha subunit
MRSSAWARGSPPARYLKENPWERLRLLRENITRTPMQMISICQGFSVGKSLVPDDMLELFFLRCLAGGIKRLFLMDGLNDIRNFEVPVRAAHKAGALAVNAVVYSISPVHTDEHFVRSSGTDDIADVLCSGSTASG